MKTVIVGATGLLGGQVAQNLIDLGHDVHAIVRDFDRASTLAEKGIKLHRGDLKDALSLNRALNEIGPGIDALITTAYGYSRRQKGDTLQSVDDVGNRNLIAASKQAGVKRFVFTSILTADLATSVPHFHQKAKTESVLEKSGLNWVSLRPGGFLDTLLEFNLDSIKKGNLVVPTDHEALATTILSRDVADCLTKSALIPNLQNERIDLGMDKPTNIIEIAAALSKALGKPIKPNRPPQFMMNIMALFNTTLKENLTAMKYVASGQYVADTTRQTELFGPPSTLEASIEKWVEDNHDKV
ncbi:MAG: SDR family oxidoreductase [Pseudomonadota bacterium]